MNGNTLSLGGGKWLTVQTGYLEIGWLLGLVSLRNSRVSRFCPVSVLASWLVKGFVNASSTYKIPWWDEGLYYSSQNKYQEFQVWIHLQHCGSTAQTPTWRCACALWSRSTAEQHQDEETQTSRQAKDKPANFVPEVDTLYRIKGNCALEEDIISKTFHPKVSLKGLFQI